MRLFVEPSLPDESSGSQPLYDVHGMATRYSRLKSVIRIISIVSALLTIIVCCSFPPWKFHFKPLSGGTYSEAERFAGYHFIAANVDPTDLEGLCNRFGIPIDSPDWQINLSRFSIHI